MYYYLQGNVAHLELGSCVIDCGGVGYKLTITGGAYEALSSSVGKTAKVFTHLAVREDGIELFGFISEDERNCFLSLIGVSGVGPKAAVSILSAMRPSELVSAIATENTKQIAKAQGIGGKTAARIILELKDKIATDVGPISAAASHPSLTHGNTGELADAIEGLMALGYDKRDINARLAGLDINGLNSGQIIQLFFKKMN
ncbi:MAG: Holliday junction branch migration protein RuvA [Clostridia bacterium]|nr:Holliday junction branch migration protein RuvA [Clostridia bacterium]